jgi:photosystem II stability/assembly factor-like uncharacterized protein
LRFASADGGATWINAALMTSGSRIGGLACGSVLACVIVSNHDSGSTLFHSADGGLTWKVVARGTPTEGVAFADSSHAFVVGRFGTIMRSEGGGAP